MAFTEHSMAPIDLHPIDVAESIAEHRAWEFDRMGDDQIAVAIEGQWRTYSITLAWSARDETLRLICTFEMEPSEERRPALHDLLNRINDACWSGAFTFWAEQGLMVFRYGLLLAGGQVASTEQVGTMIATAIAQAERYYPAFQLVAWAGHSPKDALGVAIAETYGRA